MVKNNYQKSLKFKVLARIEQEIAGDIVLRKDIEDMGSPRQISRCFKALIQMGKLVRLGWGVYAKAYISKNLNIPIIQNGFSHACREALTRLGVKWEPGWAEQDYNAGRSTQVPARTVIRLKSRYRGDLSYGKSKLIIEKGINAK